MPVAKTAPPECLRPFLFHGLRLVWDESRPDRGQARGDCPFCDREGKFSVGLEQRGKQFPGGYKCFVCGAKGNALTFLREYVTVCRTPDAAYEQLAADRKLLSPDTPRAWGAVVGAHTGEWLLPGYNARGEVVQLYKWSKDWKTGKRVLFPTPAMSPAKSGYFRPDDLDPSKSGAYLCEGPWDGMALWEVLRCAKSLPDDGLALTGSAASSLSSTTNVLAAPGASVFAESWTPVFAGKTVTLVYDSDHPRENNGRLAPPAGMAGARRTAEVLARAGEKPESVAWVRWGPDGFLPGLPSGYDVRDCLTAAGTDRASRVRALGGLLAKVEPIPADWVPGRGEGARRGGSVAVEELPCASWRELVTDWRKAMKWIDGLDLALSVALASAVSTDQMGEQLWVKMVSPPSTGKTVLCEALAVNRKYVYPKDTFTGLTSGYQTDRDGTENLSLAPKLKGKTLVIQDGDTLLSAENLPEILSQFRAFYGRNLRVSKRNRMSADFEGINCTVILAGTHRLHELDSSELGERFLDVVVVDDIDQELEEEIALRSIYQSFADVDHLSDGTLQSREGPALVTAKRRTAGYLTLLRETARERLSQVAPITEDDARRVMRYAQLVSFLRSRPSKTQQEKVQRELCARLSKQLTRLAKCLAVVLNKDSVSDPEVVRRVRRVALDTARGRTLRIVKSLYARRATGASHHQVGLDVHRGPELVRRDLHFLKDLGVTDQREPARVPGVYGKPVWVLTPRLADLWESVLEEGE